MDPETRLGGRLVRFVKMMLVAPCVLAYPIADGWLTADESHLAAGKSRPATDGRDQAIAASHPSTDDREHAISASHPATGDGPIGVAWGRLAAVYRDGRLEVMLPFDEGATRAGRVDLEVLDPNDQLIGHRVGMVFGGTAGVTRSGGSGGVAQTGGAAGTTRNTDGTGATRGAGGAGATRTRGGARSWTVTVPVGKGVLLEDLVWDRLKIDDGATSRIVPISAILKWPFVRLFAQRAYAAGSHASARIIATNASTGRPLRGSVVRLDLVDGKRSSTLFAGKTDRLGTVQAAFRMPEGALGARNLRVTTVTPLGTARLDEPVRLERRDRILLTTDKPIYQPGQTMHLRVLALDGATRQAAGGEPIVLEVEDGKGNKVFRQRGRTDRFGIASAEFELADEVNFGSYHVRAILGERDSATTREKTVTVDRYTLPKFKVEVELAGDAAKKEASYYAPGETVEGKVTARYTFGKPVTSAEVIVRLTTFDVEPVDLGRVTGRTDPEGRFSFSTKLPDSLAGRSTQQGSARISIGVDVKDTADHTESKSRDILVAADPILIMAVPESGELLPGLENRVYILTSYPDGTPAETTVSGTITPATLATDASGIAVTTLRAGNGPMTLSLRAADKRGRTARADVTLETRLQTGSLRLRADRAVYKVGDTINLETLSSKLQGAVYVDVVKDGQTIVTRAIETARGRGELALDLTPEMFGAIEVRAYQITSDADPVSDRRLIYVDPADDLEVEVTAEREIYAPGDEARIDFHVTDALGRPVAAALGIEVVDEAVFALSDKHPGFERVFMFLESELLKPRYEIHQLSFEHVLRNEFEGPEPARIEKRERAAQVLFAAAGTVRDKDLHADYGGRAIETKRGLYEAVYGWRVRQKARELAAAMTMRYKSQAPSIEGFDRDVESFYASDSAAARTLVDPWGHALVGLGKIGEREYGSVNLRSPGPDGRDGTPDDINIQALVQRRGPGAPPMTAFKGSVRTEPDVVAGRRAEIRGVVRDPRGTALVGVKVTARLRSNDKTRQVYSDPQGRFTIPYVAPGIYDVVFESGAYLTTQYEWWILDSGMRGIVEVALEPWSGATPVLAVYGSGGHGSGDVVDVDEVNGNAIFGGAFGGEERVAVGAARVEGDRGNPNPHGARDRNLKARVDEAGGVAGEMRAGVPGGVVGGVIGGVPGGVLGDVPGGVVGGVPGGVVGGVPGGVVGGVPGGVVGGVPAKVIYSDSFRKDLPALGRNYRATLDLAPGVNDPSALLSLGYSGAAEAGGEGRGPRGTTAGDENPPRVRSFFPETLYTNPALVTDGTGRASIRVPMADSITTWRVTSLASTEHGALGSSSAPIRVFKDFFIDLDLPVAVTKDDRISVPVAVYNYLTAPQRVSLELRQDPWFTLDDDVSVKEIDVGAGEVSVAYFRIKTSTIGAQQLQVTARLENAPAGTLGDAVARPVEVRPDGEERAVVVNERLEGEATQEIVIPADAIPEASKIFVKFYPGALSQLVEGLDSILRMPGGCFEQTSSSTYPDVLVMDYLRTSNKLTPEIQAKAEQYIALGYQRLVTFEVPGGGFSWFGGAPANKILTAYGLMEFYDMSRVHEVDTRLIERTQRWLAAQQQPDGSFKPDLSNINDGATNRYNTDVERITAYIGWALAATGYKGAAVERARAYVATHLTGKEDAYTTAVIANFAADGGGAGAWTEAAIDALAGKATEEPKTAFWKQEGETPTSARERSADLETTALAAQALLKTGRKSALARKALDYLTGRKDSFGNWGTTQATILSLKAFLLSFVKGQNADTAGTIEVSVDGKPAARVPVTKENNDLLEIVDLKPFTHEGEHAIGLSFAGQGSMQYQIVGRYFVPWAVSSDEGSAPGEPLSIDLEYDRTHLAQDEVATAKVRVCNNTPATAKLVIVDLGIPPGFEPSSDDFAALVEQTRGRAGGRLEKYTITAKQVILYLDALTPNQRVEFSFGLRAKFPVRAKTFSSRVYEYYNPSVEARTRPVEMTIVARSGERSDRSRRP